MPKTSSRDQSSSIEDLINKFENLIAENPHNAEFHKELGNAFHRSGQYELALEEYRTALHIDSAYFPAQYNMGNTYFRTGAYHQAIISWQKAYIMNPQLEHAIYNIAFTYYKLGTQAKDNESRRRLLDDAVLEFNKAIAMNSTNTDTHLHLGLTWYELDHYEEAVREYREVLRLDANDMYAHYNLGNVFYEMGHKEPSFFGRALEEYRQSIRNNPKDLRSHNNIADCLLRVGKADQALAEIDAVLTANQDYIPAHCTRGEICAALGRTMEAIGEFQRVIELDPKKHDVVHRYAAQKLIEQYDLLLARTPGDHAIHHQLGLSYRDLGLAYGERSFLIKARDEFRTAIERHGSRMAYHLALGETFMHLNNTDLALLEMERCLSIQADSILAHAVLAEIYLQAGDRELVQQELATIRRLQSERELDTVKKGTARPAAAKGNGKHVAVAKPANRRRRLDA